MVLRLDSHHSGIYHMTGHLLVLQGDDPIVSEGLEGLPVFALKHFKLFPPGFVVIGFFGINV